MALKANLHKVGTLLVRIWISLDFTGDHISKRAHILSNFTLMPHWFIMKPKNLSNKTSNTHLSRVISMKRPHL